MGSTTCSVPISMRIIGYKENLRGISCHTGAVAQTAAAACRKRHDACTQRSKHRHHSKRKALENNLGSYSAHSRAHIAQCSASDVARRPGGASLMFDETLPRLSASAPP